MTETPRVAESEPYDVPLFDTYAEIERLRAEVRRLRDGIAGLADELALMAQVSQNANLWRVDCQRVAGDLRALLAAVDAGG